MTVGPLVTPPGRDVAVERDRTRVPGPAVARALAAPGAWLAAIVGVSFAIRAWLSLGAVSPWVLPDELVYSDLARSLAEGGRPSVRGVPVFGWGEVYPTLVAPVWALVDDRYVAYHVALVVNAFVMSLAAVPAYFLARLVVARRSALLVAACTVLVPSLSYTGALLTENAFYPLFLLSLLAVARAVRRPTLGAQALALLAIGALTFTRIQAAALLAGYAGAVVTYGLTSASGRLGYLRRFVPSALVGLAAAPAPFVVSVGRGEGVFGWLGQRSGTFDEFRIAEVPRWFAFLGIGLVLYVAVIPAAATAIVAATGLSRRAAEPLRLFAAVSLPTFAAVLLGMACVSASFDVDGIGNLNERYVFYLVPLTFVGLALWIEQGLPRPRPWALVTVACACVLPVLLPIDRLDYNAGLQALALLPWGELSESSVGIALLVGACTLALGTTWLCVGHRSTWLLWALVGTWLAALGLFAVESNSVSATRTAASFEGKAATWVDDALPPGAEVTVVWDENRARKGLPDSFYFWLMVTEFFNEAVGDVYRLGPPTFYEVFLPTIPASIGPGRVLVDRHGLPVRAAYALVTCRTPVRGRVVAQAPRGALRLVRVDGPIALRDVRGCVRAHP